MMEMRYVDGDGVRIRDPHEPIGGPDGGFTWVDVPEWSPEVEMVLRGLGCHEKVLEACRRRNHVPTVHAYVDHLFITTQSPLLGGAGHVHLLELDQIVGRDYLVTVHGPLNPIVDPAQAMVETDAALRRIASGRFRPATPYDLSFADHLRGRPAAARPDHRGGRQAARPRAARDGLPPDPAGGAAGADVPDPARADHHPHHGRAVLRRVGAPAALARVTDEAAKDHARDLTDQFDRVRSIADGESQFLFGVIELYQTKVNTKMTVAMERLAVIAAVTLPITAIASIEGMNMIVAVRENRTELTVVLLFMLVMSFLLLRWARRQGWW